MSNWTHVAAVVRIDDLRFEPETKESIVERFTKHFGKSFDYEDADWDEVEIAPDSFLPFGSEGSLKMDVIVNPDTSYLAAYVVVIWGDLRDHYDSDAIVKWFKAKLEDLCVRQACITVRNEQNGQAVWSTDTDSQIDKK